MIQKLLLILTALFANCLVFSQTNDSLSVKKMDKAVKVYEQSNDNTSITFELDKNFELTNPRANVATWLALSTPAIVRNVAPGMSATVSINGAGSQRTALNWNGFRIKNACLGLTDFSLIPLSFFEAISLKAGSATATNGNSAIGGSVYLKNNINIDTTFTIDGAIEGGSFFNIGGNVNASYSILKNFSGATKYFGNYAKNNFVYTDQSQIGFPTAKRQNASFLQHQAMQNFTLKIADNHFLKSTTWFSYIKREIPAAIGAGNDSAMQTDKIWRSTLAYIGNLAPFKIQVGIAYFNQLLRYKTIFIDSPTKLSTFKARFGLGFSCLPNLHFNLNSRIKHITANVENYNGNISELRGEIALKGNYKPHKSVTLQLTGRTQFVERFSAQWAIAAGTNILIFKHKSWQLHASANGERFYRIPTLNDRYWQPGGNPALQPESGWQTRIGLPLQWQRQSINLQASVFGFYSPIHNLILWQPQPQGYWSPENYKKVITTGASFRFSLAWHANKNWMLQLKTFYAYTSSVNAENSPSAGKQVIYVPNHKATTQLNLQWKGLFLSPSVHFTGSRYILANNSQKLPEFFLLNCSVGYTWTPKNFSLTFYLRSQNITNTAYERVYRQPMPGWQLYGGVRLAFKKENHLPN